MASEPASNSEFIRKAIENYFDFADNPREFVMLHCWDVIVDEVRGLLANAVHDKRARDTLKRLAAKEPTESDFG